MTYNPLGPEPQLLSERSTAEPDQDPEKVVDVTLASPPAENRKAEKDEDVVKASSPSPIDDDIDEQKGPNSGKDAVRLEDPDGKHDSPAESKDWADLTMKQKLVALHMLTEWQFDNPHRLRQLMKDDGDGGHWVSANWSNGLHTLIGIQRIEPIGYDAKTNAYWLVGRKFPDHE